MRRSKQLYEKCRKENSGKDGGRLSGGSPSKVKKSVDTEIERCYTDKAVSEKQSRVSTLTLAFQMTRVYIKNDSGKTVCIELDAWITLLSTFFYFIGNASAE